MRKNLKVIHPGVVLAEIYMKEMGLNQTRLSKLCGCSIKKINEIINQKRPITPELAITFERVLGTSAEMWVRMQAEFNLWMVRNKKDS